jgi:TRAP-type transport system periplasmic protein
MILWARRIAAAVTTVAALTATTAFAQTKIDLAIFHPERNFWTMSIKWWIDEVEKATQGRVKFVPHYAGALVSVNETLKSVRDGAVPAGNVSMGAVSGQLPAVAILEAIGGMPADPGKFIEAYNAVRPVVEDLFRRQNTEILWTQGSGPLIVVCRDRHMKTIADWKGRKVRTAGRWQAEQIIALGASAVSMDPSEQYLALQNRTIDCALSVSVLASALKLHEVAPKVTVLHLPVNVSGYLVHKPIFDKISAEDRATIKRLGQEAEKKSAPHLITVQAEATNAMKSAKADVYPLTDAELAEFRKGIEPAFAKMEAQGGEAGKQIGTILKQYW